MNEKFLVDLCNLYCKLYKTSTEKDCLDLTRKEILSKIKEEITDDISKESTMARYVRIQQIIIEILDNRFNFNSSISNLTTIESLLGNLDRYIKDEQAILNSLLSFETIVPITHRNIDRLFGISEDIVEKALEWQRKTNMLNRNNQD